VVLSSASGALRVGIINLMPRAENYERYLLRPLDRTLLAVSPVWIRLGSHRYSSSDAERIRSAYLTFDEALARGRLDAVVLTGAPVEELAFEEVRYWAELSEILQTCRRGVASTLGLCWGALALARQLGVDKALFPAKLFGVFENRHLLADHPITGGTDDSFWCAHSRHSGILDRDLEREQSAGNVRLLSHGAETGYTVFETVDHRFLMHLGHPEYEAERLVEEWKRDTALGRTDVPRPQNLDLERPRTIWRSHCNELVTQWLRFVAEQRPGSTAEPARGATAEPRMNPTESDSSSRSPRSPTPGSANS